MVHTTKITPSSWIFVRKGVSPLVPPLIVEPADRAVATPITPTQNNTGVVKLALDKEDNKAALKCFEKALKADPNHTPATFNKAHGAHGAAALQLDRTGAAGAIDDGRGKLELANAVTFAPEQQLEVRRGVSGRRCLPMNWLPAKHSSC